MDGEMELTMGDEARICRKGDEYLIPAQAEHHARFLRRSRVIDFFSERNRYNPRSTR
jgi:quercetin dioxygenase-like cupin family protein